MDIHYFRPKERDIPDHEEITVVFIPDISTIIPNKDNVEFYFLNN